MESQQFSIQKYCSDLEKYLGDQEGSAKPFWRALSFAVDAHSDQKRKSGEPYVSHPCLVARILVEELGVDDPETLAAAVLHDTVEDVPEVTSELIGELFGRNVENIVDGCTKIANFSGDRQSFYAMVHKKLFSGAAARVEVMLVKLADRLHNLRTMGAMPKHKRQKIADETLSVYAPMAKVMGLFQLQRELYDLALENKFPRQSQKILAQIKKIVEGDELKEIKSKIQTELENAWVSADVYMAPKGLWGYFDYNNRVLLKEIEIPAEIIVSTRDIQSCYRTMGVVNLLFPPIPRTIRDFIANPKPTGYQSLHARANIKGTTYRFKFRTDQMYHVGRHGIVKMWLDHRKIPSDFEKEIQEMFGILGDDDSGSYRDIIAASGKKEIYTFTPKGDRVCLPKQSTVLDFAFKVHTEVGRRCSAAMVGSKKVGLTHILCDGDRVKIYTKDKPVRFDPAIQASCHSPKARSELSKMFRMRKIRLALSIGESLVYQEMKHYGLPADFLNKIEMEDVLEGFELESTDELFNRIGNGRLSLKNVMQEIRKKVCPDYETLQPPTGALNRFFLNSLDPVCIKFSHCCDPNPTEKALMGLLSKRGLSVHKKDCEKLTSLSLQREDVVELRWNLKETRVRNPQTIIIPQGYNRNRILMMLGVAPNQMQIQEIVALSTLPNGEAAWQINFKVRALHDLKSVLAHFNKANIGYDFELEH
jgi:guanosine-3',5'-bis(diphosphate) 3'-pyrophosphohydrolase